MFLTHEHLHIFYKHKNKEKRVKYLERRVFISYGYISFINMFFLTFQTGASIQKKRIRYRFDRGGFKNDIENYGIESLDSFFEVSMKTIKFF